ncbi:hypothetical protein ANN_25263 [Periplaneta americana]|uniref:Uncharacterized protein n=1 Tax=Periplaneta americana TaxID=6978 RepID=A0ABQ8S136_PERAM|nr:hypothetical protein ANN_25263 [Periplaneta americana]
MAGLCEGGNEPSGSLKAICKNGECDMTNVQIDSKNLRASPDPTSVQVYDPRTKTLKVQQRHTLTTSGGPESRSPERSCPVIWLAKELALRDLSIDLDTQH